MEEFIYIEVDEEITSIIDRIHKVKANKFGLVVPRGAAVLQSIVNLKLIKKEVEKAKKTIAVVTVDKIGRNLASQVGLPVYDDIKQAAVTVAESGKKQPPESDVIEIDMSKEGEKSDGDGTATPAAVEDTVVPEGVNVHYYDKAGGDEAAMSKHKESTSKLPAEESSGFKSRSVGGATGNKAMQEVMKSKIGKGAGGPKRLKLKIIIGIIAALVAATTIWVVITKAEIKVGVAAEEFESTANDITIDAASLEGDLDAAKVSGSLIEASKEVKQTFKTTGKKQTGDKASGTLDFYNSVGGDKVIAAGTILTGPNGLKYATTAAVTVPTAVVGGSGEIVAGKTTGGVIAQEAGSEYNTATTASYTVVGSSSVTAKGAMIGGTTKEVGIVSASDITDSQDKLSFEASADLRDQLKSTAGEKYVIESAVSYSLDGFTSSKNANDEADSFEAQATVKAQAIVFEESKLREFMNQYAAKNVAAGKSLLASEEDTITPTLVSLDSPKKEMHIKAVLKSHVGDALNTDGLANQVKGKTVKAARQVVSEKLGNDNVEITVRPNIGIVRLPFLSKNIKFKLDYLNQAQDSGSQESSQ